MKGSSKHIFMTCFVVLTFCFIVSSTVPAQTIQNPQLPQLQFSQVPPASRAKYTGDRFSYMEAGPKNAPVLLLAHGVGANSMHWLYQYPVLGQRYRVIAWNAPGYMLTDNLVAEEPTCKDYADAMNDFLTSLGIEKVLSFRQFNWITDVPMFCRHLSSESVQTGFYRHFDWRPPSP